MPFIDMTANALNDKEPQRVNNCLLHLTGIDDGALFTLAVESFPLPKVNMGIIELSHLNEKRKYAGNPVFEDLSVVLKDLIEVNVARSLTKWFQQTYDPATGQIGYARDYKKSGYVEMLPPNGDTDLSRQYDLQGVWISAYDPGDADKAGEDFIRVNLTLTIDKATPSTNIAA